MSDNEQTLQAPDGIADEHARPVSGWRRHASPLSLVVFGLVIALSLVGALGHERDLRVEGNGVSLDVHSPETIRNGEMLEVRIGVESDRPISNLVVGVEQSLWEDMTVNTMIPAPTEETSADGEFRFSFGELQPGAPFLLKVDLQINPDILGGNDGRVTVYDGESAVVETDISITVLP
jgi:hypothetical protein